MTQPVQPGLASLVVGAPHPDSPAAPVASETAQAFRSALAVAFGRPVSNTATVAEKDARPATQVARSREAARSSGRDPNGGDAVVTDMTSRSSGSLVVTVGSETAATSETNYLLQADGAWPDESPETDYRADAFGFVDVPLAAALAVPLAAASRAVDETRTGSPSPLVEARGNHESIDEERDGAGQHRPLDGAWGHRTYVISSGTSTHPGLSPAAAYPALAHGPPTTAEDAETRSGRSEPPADSLIRRALDARGAIEQKVGDDVHRASEYLTRSSGVAGASAAGVDPARTITDPDALDPELRRRLDRVIDRMASEFGHRVEVVETVRSRERQDRLYASGRSEPGPVVTWTRNSRHLDGEAADVRIDGGWSDARAFLRLNRIADQEGLRTLWPRDPGHIELATISDRGAKVASSAPDPAARSSTLVGSGQERRERGGGGSTDPLPVRIQPHPFARAGEAQVVTPPPTVATPPAPLIPAGVAQVAPVAQVARVAAIAEVADPATAASEAGLRRTARRSESPGRSQREDGSRLTAVGSSFVELTPALSNESRIARSSREIEPLTGTFTDPRPQTPRDQVLEVQSPGVSSELTATTAESLKQEIEHDLLRVLTRETGLQTPSVPGRQATIESLRSDSAERIARVLRLQESAPERPLSSVLLRLDTADGGQDQIRVDLRGASVETTLDVRDAQTVENLKLHTPELQRALERQGLEGESITVRNTNRGAESAAGAQAQERDASKLAQVGSSPNSSAGGGGREGGRGNAAARQDDSRREGGARDRKHDKGGR
ncbi:MAG: hypothetical protein ACT4OZ_11160 [Gemmatimonadota bacterium]